MSLTPGFLLLNRNYTAFSLQTYPVNKIRLTLVGLPEEEIETIIYEDGITYCIWKGEYRNTNPFPVIISRLELLCSHPTYSILAFENVNIDLPPGETLEIYWKIIWNAMTPIISLNFISDMKNNFKISKTSNPLTHFLITLTIEGRSAGILVEPILKEQGDYYCLWEKYVTNTTEDGILDYLEGINLSQELLILIEDFNINWNFLETKRIEGKIEYIGRPSNVTIPSPNIVSIEENVEVYGDFNVYDASMVLEFSNDTFEEIDLQTSFPVLVRLENNTTESGELEYKGGVDIFLTNDTEETESNLGILPSMTLSFSNDTSENSELSPSLNPLLSFSNDTSENHQLDTNLSLMLNLQNITEENSEFSLGDKTKFVDGERRKKFDKGFTDTGREKWLP